jgi:hypothetical protein
MSRDDTIAVEIRTDPGLDELLRDVDAAYRRAEKSEPGERTEIVTYEALSSALELRAAAALLDETGRVVDLPDRSTLTAGVFLRHEGSVTVSITLPLEHGSTERGPAVGRAPEPAAPVEVRDDLWGRQLVLERFRSQLDAAIADPGVDRSSALSPSGVHNRVLTEVLREYVQRGDRAPVSVPVAYRDGSRASADFPFHCLDLTSVVTADDEAKASGVLVLRLALLSIRHTEMDAIVDGSWLRNADVSKPRAAAQTDDFVYEASLRQLEQLTAGGRRARIYMFQTGLETAVVGFFRAVVEFLREHPGQLEVIPMFFVKNPHTGDLDSDDFAGYERGEVWATTGSR